MEEADLSEFKKNLNLLVTTKMPFGKYKGIFISDLPEPYLVWFKQKGFPDGRIGKLLGLACEIKLNGLNHLLTPLKNKS